MFSTHNLKPQFQEFVRPYAQKCVQKGLTANHITLATAGASVGLGLVLTVFAKVSVLFYLLPVFLLIRMILNAIDGIMAREFMQESAQGGYFNEVGDLLSDAALYLPFAFILPAGGFLIGVLLWLASVCEVFGLLGKIHGFNGRRYDGFAKSDRAAFFSILALWYAIAGSLNAWASFAVVIVIALTLYTCYLRFQNGLKAKV